MVIVTVVVGSFMMGREEPLPANVLEASRRLDGSYAQSIALGLPVTQEELLADLRVPDEENAALVILPLADSLDPIPYDDDLRSTPDVARQRTPGLLQLLADSDETLDRIVQSTSIPGWYVEHDYDQGPFIEFPEYADLKAAGKLLIARGIDSALSGDADAAMTDLLACRRLGEYLRNAPHLMGVLVALSIDAQALIGAERLAEIWHDKLAALSTLRSTLAGSEFEVDPISALRGDFYMGLATGRNLDLFGGLEWLTDSAGEEWVMPIDGGALRRDGLPPGDLERAYLNGHLEIWNSVFAEISNDPSLLRGSGEYIDQNFGEETIPNDLNYLFVAMTLIDFGALDMSLSRSDVRRDLTDALLKVLIYRVVRGTMPDSLAQADAEFDDPFAPGSSVRYATDGDAVKIWSVGQDGQDNNGELDDVGVRYPMTKWP